jgi:hypothetical protein
MGGNTQSCPATFSSCFSTFVLNKFLLLVVIFFFKIELLLQFTVDCCFFFEQKKFESPTKSKKNENQVDAIEKEKKSS